MKNMKKKEVEEWIHNHMYKMMMMYYDDVGFRNMKNQYIREYNRGQPLSPSKDNRFNISYEKIKNLMKPKDIPKVEIK
tara:strand:- start:120 stop:353 length:234 start_codon:yes stop_codon:yes gene_type:complete